MKKISKKIFRILGLIVILVLLILIFIWGINKFIKYKYKKILIDNDSLNYEITQIIDGNVEQNSKLRNNTLVIDDSENVIWINGNTNKSIIMNKTKKTAIVTNESDVKVASLNETYINEYFENKNNKFKYLGKENKYELLQFTNENLGLITILYLNLDTKLIEKQVIKNDIGESVIEYKIKLNSVSKDEIKEPELLEYNIVNQ